MKFIASFLIVFLIGLIQNGESGPSSRRLPPLGRAMREEFFMDPDYIQLNHGAYGTYPKAVSRALHEYQERSERNPDLWIRRDARTEWDRVRKLLADLISADTDDVVLVPNTTSGINAVLRSMVFNLGERILHFSTVYNSMGSIIQYLVDYSDGAISKLVFNITYPMTNNDLLQKFETFLNETHDPAKPIRVALIDHISSVPSVVNPINQMVTMLQQRNISVLVDGAHAIGQVPINVTEMAPDFYVTNAHKWLYAARGCALLYVDKKHQGSVHPAHINSGYRNPSNFVTEFFWTGTMDYSQCMTVPAALQFREEAGGEETIMEYNHNLALQGGQRMAEILGTEVLHYPDQVGSMVDVGLPIMDVDNPILTDAWWIDEQLYHHPETFSSVYKHNGKWWVRVSAQIYNDVTDFEFSARHFQAICNEANGNSTLNRFL